MTSVLTGCALQILPTLSDQSIHCCVTSPPYWGLRDYGVAGQMGLEKSPEEYTATMVQVFREVRRVLRDDGTLWLNIGDSYAANRGYQVRDGKHVDVGNHMGSKVPGGLKEKDLIGIPWRVAFALQSDGWWLRSDIIWAKPNCMPESVEDRPTRSHEYLFLLSKSKTYHYDNEAIKEPCKYPNDLRRPYAPGQVDERGNGHDRRAKNPIRTEKQRGHSRRHNGFNDRWDQMERSEQCSGMRNKRDVWTVAPANYKDAHFATFPPDLIRPCILAGCPIGGTVLDPFAGSGTTGQVAISHGRRFVGIELNPDYVTLIRQRLENTQPGFM